MSGGGDRRAATSITEFGGSVLHEEDYEDNFVLIRDNYTDRVTSAAARTTAGDDITHQSALADNGPDPDE
jgi:hypothetical protein